MSRRRPCRTGKARYPDHQAALGALRRIQRRNTREVVPVRIYDCALCRGWHLTSTPTWTRGTAVPVRGRP